MRPFREERGGRRGSRNDRGSGGAPELTPEEQNAVDAEFEQFRGQVVHEQLVAQFHQLVTARGLARYASEQILTAGAGPDGSYRHEPVERAIAAASKAYRITGLPVYLYDMATYVEKAGMVDATRRLLAMFLEQAASFAPDQVEAAFLRERDLEEAFREARTKIERHASRSELAPADAHSTCERCGGAVRPSTGACERCGWARTATATSQSAARARPAPGDAAAGRPTTGGTARFPLRTVALVALGGVLLTAAVMGLMRPRSPTDSIPDKGRTVTTSRRHVDVPKLVVGKPSARELAAMLNPERAHARILDGIAILRKSLTRDGTDDSGYQKVIQVALDGMVCAVEAQRAAEEDRNQPPRDSAYRSSLERVRAEIDAFIERYNRGDAGRDQAVSKEALAPLEAAVAGYRAAYEGPSEMPQATDPEAVASPGQSGSPEEPSGARGQSPRGHRAAGAAPAADSTATPREDGGEGQAPGAGTEASQPSPSRD